MVPLYKILCKRFIIIYLRSLLNTRYIFFLEEGKEKEIEVITFENMSNYISDLNRSEGLQMKLFFCISSIL